MRITFVLPILEVSGGARIIAGHAKRLADRGHKVVLVAPRPRQPTFKEKMRALLRGESRIDPFDHAPAALSGVSLRVPQHPGPIEEGDVPDADVVIATWWETAEWINRFAPQKGRKVHFIQHFEAFPEMPVERVLAVWRLPFFKIAIAQWLIDIGRNSFEIEEMALVPNSIDHDLFDAPPRDKGEPPTLGFLFHKAPFKDLETTVQAASLVRQNRPDVRLVSFGASMPERGEIPEDCQFTLLPSQEEIARIYRECDVWLSTSKTEGFNLPPLEAMGSGCPSVCSKTGRPLEIVRDGVNGYLVDAGDVQGFADAALRILSLSNAEWRKMSEAARQSVAHPNWDESSRLFEEALVRAVTL